MTNQELFAKLRPIVMLATGVPECILADQVGPGSMPAPQRRIRNDHAQAVH